MNKGLEVIEASVLFDCDADDIQVAVHPQSIIHSMVEFKDGSTVALLDNADMRNPILYALSYPEREIRKTPPFDIFSLPPLTFERPDFSRFKCLSLAYDVLNKGGIYPCVMNAANEKAVELFLNEKIGFMDIYDFVSKLRPDTRTAVITLASNVTGKLLPVSRIANICKNKGIVLICDAAQAAGCVPVNVNSLGIDVLCFAGHKSLYGPQGVGGILFRKGIEPECIMEGGNGINSASKLMEGLLPERLEAGTMNTPGICGLNAGISYVSKIGINEIFERNSELARLLTEKLSNIPGVTLYGLSDSKTPVVLFNKKGYMSEELAAVLGEKRICVRGGFHCAPLAHAALGTGDGGAVRVSMTFSNTVNEIDAFVTVLNRI